MFISIFFLSIAVSLCFYPIKSDCYVELLLYVLGTLQFPNLLLYTFNFNSFNNSINQVEFFLVLWSLNLYPFILSVVPNSWSKRRHFSLYVDVDLSTNKRGFFLPKSSFCEIVGLSFPLRLSYYCFNSLIFFIPPSYMTIVVAVGWVVVVRIGVGEKMIPLRLLPIITTITTTKMLLIIMTQKRILKEMQHQRQILMK